MTWTFREIDKPLAWRLDELLQSLLVLRDSLQGLSKQQSHQIIPLSGQLRALLTDRSRAAAPLLVEISKLVGQDLTIYAMPGHEVDDLPVKDALAVYIKGFPVSPDRVLPGQAPIALDDLLRREIVIVGDKKYSVEELIEWFANKAGGAHFSRRVPEDFAQLLLLPVVGKQPLVSALRQIGNCTFQVGRRLIKSLVDFDIHLLLAIRDSSPAKPVTLLDARYINTAMRLSLRLLPLGKLEFRVSGLQEQSAVIPVGRLIDWSLVRHVHVRLFLADDLSTDITLFVDSELVARSVIPAPIFVASEILAYDLYLNRSADDDPQDFSFGLVELAMFTGQDPVGAAKLELYYADKRVQTDLRCVAFAPRSWSQTPPGTTDQTVHGDAPWRHAWEFLGVDPPGAGQEPRRGQLG